MRQLQEHAATRRTPPRCSMSFILDNPQPWRRGRGAIVAAADALAVTRVAEN